jgi:hypothetical protein
VDKWPTRTLLARVTVPYKCIGRDEGQYLLSRSRFRSMHTYSGAMRLSFRENPSENKIPIQGGVPTGKRID